MEAASPDRRASKPFILAVEHDKVSRSVLNRELTRRYGDDYSVRVEVSAVQAAEVRPASAGRGEPVTHTHAHAPEGAVAAERIIEPVIWGVLVGAIQAASPLAISWIEPATAHALYIAFIAAVYIGFAVADGRPHVIAVESAVAGAFLILATAGVEGSAWLLVAGYTAHGLKDFWQHRNQFVTNTRWWPPFCAAVDLLVAAVLTVEIAAGVNLH